MARLPADAGVTELERTLGRKIELRLGTRYLVFTVLGRMRARMRSASGDPASPLSPEDGMTSARLGAEGLVSADRVAAAFDAYRPFGWYLQAKRLLDRGSIELAISEAARSALLLGECLVQAGRITPTDRDAILAEMRDRRRSLPEILGVQGSLPSPGGSVSSTFGRLSALIIAATVAGATGFGPRQAGAETGAQQPEVRVPYRCRALLVSKTTEPNSPNRPRPQLPSRTSPPPRRA